MGGHEVGTLGLLRIVPRTGNVQQTMKALAGLLCVLLAGCAAPQASSSSPSPSASITFQCRPIYCPDVAKGAVLEGAVLEAVAGFGYPVKTVLIEVLGYSCGVPDASGIAPPCPDPRILPRAYVSFVGTDQTAIVELGKTTGGPGIYTVGSVELLPVPSAPSAP